ncbi:MAG: hypothetical protein WBA77_14165 [Microcoleaceae cyanobacterium]
MSLIYSDSLTQTITNIFAENRSTYGENIDSEEIEDPLNNASAEVKDIIEQVLQAERDKLYMKNPRNIKDDILKIIKEVIQ